MKDPAVKPGVGARIAAPKPGTDPETTSIVPDDDAEPKFDRSGAPAAKSKAVAGGVKTIVGKIASIDEKRLTVTSGQRTIHFELADILTIKVELSDPKMIQNDKDILKSKIEGPGASGHLVSLLASDLVGSKILVRGTGAESKSGKQCTAKTIEVTLKTPLKGQKPTSTAASTVPAEK